MWALSKAGSGAPVTRHNAMPGFMEAAGPVLGMSARASFLLRPVQLSPETQAADQKRVRVLRSGRRSPSSKNTCPTAQNCNQAVRSQADHVSLLEAQLCQPPRHVRSADQDGAGTARARGSHDDIALLAPHFPVQEGCDCHFGEQTFRRDMVAKWTPPGVLRRHEFQKTLYSSGRGERIRPERWWRPAWANPTGQVDLIPFMI